MSPIFPFLVLVVPFLTLLIVFLTPRIKVQFNKEKYYSIIARISFLLIGAIALATLASRSLIETRDYTFNGIIEKVYYEKPKQIPHITIKGVEYDVGGLYHGNYDTIVVGDSAIKEKGVFEFKLIKHRNQ